MSNLYTYNPKMVVVTIGPVRVTGFAEDSFITVDPSTDGVTKKVGADGELVRSISPDDTYVVKIVVHKYAAINRYLELRLKADRESCNGLIPGISVDDKRGGALFNASKCWVVRSASVQYGRESGNREWEIHTAEGTLNERPGIPQ
jgi:hypothetical protein